MPLGFAVAATQTANSIKKAKRIVVYLALNDPAIIDLEKKFQNEACEEGVLRELLGAVSLAMCRKNLLAAFDFLTAKLLSDERLS